MSPLQLLPWQAPLWRIVSQAIAQDRLGHALLLSGMEGTGKRPFARLLAAALWCEKPQAEHLPCGQCGNCRQVLSEAHPGFTVLRPEEGKRDISIDAVRLLCERMIMTSHDGRSKVAIVDPVDSLNRNGVNALLKTIEEPPPRSHLLLIAERPLALPPTLRSRCQQLRFAIPPREQGLAWLAQSEVGTPAQHAIALDAARGAPVRALKLLEEKTLDQQQTWKGTLLDLAAGRSEPLKAAADVGEEQAGAFLRWLYGWLLELLRTGLASGAGQGETQALARSLPRHAMDRYVGEIQESLRRLETNARAQLVLESVMIRWSALVALGRRT